MDSACFSLLQVLRLYYAKPPIVGLQIITDKSLQINNATMVSETKGQFGSKLIPFFLCYNLCCCTMCMIDNFQRKCQAFKCSQLLISTLEHNTNIEVTVSDIQFDRSVWSAQNSNVSFVNCDMKLLILFCDGNIGSHLHISRSQIGGQINIQNSSALLENCNLFQQTVSHENSIITVYNSTIAVKLSEVSNFEGGWFLQVGAGIVNISDVKFENSVSTKSLISATMKSLLLVENCTFITNNYSLIDIEELSLGIITNSNFTQNTIISDSKAVIKSLVRSFKGSVVLVRMCNFYNNSLNVGSAVSLIQNDIGLIVDSYFIDNNGRGVYTFNTHNFAITNCRFSTNQADFGAAVAVLQDTSYQSDKRFKIEHILKRFSHKFFDIEAMKTLLSAGIVSSLLATKWQIVNCIFVHNTAGSGGAILAENMSLAFRDSMFENNSAISPPLEEKGSGGAILLIKSFVNVSGCTFVANKASFGGGISGDGDLNVYSSNFINNEALNGEMAQGGALYIRNPSIHGRKNTFISNCSFHRNQAADTGGAILTDFFLRIHDTTFQGNTAGSAGGVMFSSSTNITNSVFEDNAAYQTGGALVFLAGSQIDLRYCSFTNNTASSGAAISASSNSSLSCYNCSFFHNIAVSR